MRVSRARISGSMLSRLGARWVMTTKAMLGSAGMALNKYSSASTPPAEAPTPTIGKRASIGCLCADSGSTSPGTGNAGSLCRTKPIASPRAIFQSIADPSSPLRLSPSRPTAKAMDGQRRVAPFVRVGKIETARSPHAATVPQAILSPMGAAHLPSLSRPSGTFETPRSGRAPARARARCAGGDGRARRRRGSTIGSRR
jgi:hypothetical protein